MRVIILDHSLTQSQQALPCLAHRVPTSQRGEAEDPQSGGASVLPVTAALFLLMRVSIPHNLSCPPTGERPLPTSPPAPRASASQGILGPGVVRTSPRRASRQHA